LYQALLRDSSLFDLLLRFDEDLAEEARTAGCACGGALHRACYERKPRGGPAGLGPAHAVRFSYCCEKEGCRRRTTPGSLRFLGRKVFFGVVVLLVPVLRDGPTPKRLERSGPVLSGWRARACLRGRWLARHCHPHCCWPSRVWERDGYGFWRCCGFWPRLRPERVWLVPHSEGRSAPAEDASVWGRVAVLASVF
jgi:hypothetical protein